MRITAASTTCAPRASNMAASAGAWARARVDRDADAGELTRRAPRPPEDRSRRQLRGREEVRRPRGEHRLGDLGPQPGSAADAPVRDPRRPVPGMPTQPRNSIRPPPIASRVGSNGGLAGRAQGGSQFPFGAHAGRRVRVLELREERRNSGVGRASIASAP